MRISTREWINLSFSFSFHLSSGRTEDLRRRTCHVLPDLRSPVLGIGKHEFWSQPSNHKLDDSEPTSSFLQASGGEKCKQMAFFHVYLLIGIDHMIDCTWEKKKKIQWLKNVWKILQVPSTTHCPIACDFSPVTSVYRGCLPWAMCFHFWNQSENDKQPQLNFLKRFNWEMS